MKIQLTIITIDDTTVPRHGKSAICQPCNG